MQLYIHHTILSATTAFQIQVITAKKNAVYVIYYLCRCVVSGFGQRCLQEE